MLSYMHVSKLCVIIVRSLSVHCEDGNFLRQQFSRDTVTVVTEKNVCGRWAESVKLIIIEHKFVKFYFQKNNFDGINLKRLSPPTLAALTNVTMTIQQNRLPTGKYNNCVVHTKYSVLMSPERICISSSSPEGSTTNNMSSVFTRVAVGYTPASRTDRTTGGFKEEKKRNAMDVESTR